MKQQRSVPLEKEGHETQTTADEVSEKIISVARTFTGSSSRSCVNGWVKMSQPERDKLIRSKTKKTFDQESRLYIGYYEDTQGWVLISVARKGDMVNAQGMEERRTVPKTTLFMRLGKKKKPNQPASVVPDYRRKTGNGFTFLPSGEVVLVRELRHIASH